MSTLTHNEPGYVYFALADDGLTKIGATRDANHRLLTLQVEIWPKKLLIFCPCKVDTVACERTFHHWFKDKRKYKEWFKLDVDDWAAWFEETGNANWPGADDILKDVHTLITLIGEGVKIVKPDVWRVE